MLTKQGEGIADVIQAKDNILKTSRGQARKAVRAAKKAGISPGMSPEAATARATAKRATPFADATASADATRAASTAKVNPAAMVDDIADVAPTLGSRLGSSFGTFKNAIVNNPKKTALGLAVAGAGALYGGYKYKQGLTDAGGQVKLAFIMGV